MTISASPTGLKGDWSRILSNPLASKQMQELRVFLRERYRAGARIFPPKKEFFSAFEYTDFNQVKIVIIGQDPYHGPGQAHGMCFSVRPGIAVPPSLRNIFLELKRDLDIEIPEHGFLLSWALQGVLLLNATLTVEFGAPGSHQNKGWEFFTDSAIQNLSEKREHLVFLLWGAFAQKKSALINADRHLILQAPHPSPLSAHRGFLGCGHFSKANTYLQKHGLEPIDWGLPSLAELKELGLV